MQNDIVNAECKVQNAERRISFFKDKVLVRQVNRIMKAIVKVEVSFYNGFLVL